MDDTTSTTTAPDPASPRTPWEPPFDGSEAEAVHAALTRLRTTFRWKADGLDLDGLTRTVGASTLTLGSLLKHLACVEDEKFGMSLSGAGYGPPWAGMPDFDGSASRVHVLHRRPVGRGPVPVWDDAVRRSDERLPQRSRAPATSASASRWAPTTDYVVNLRRLLLDMVEEYGRHTGHADLLREAVDGRVGEDPPEGWVAESGSSPVGVQPA